MRDDSSPVVHYTRRQLLDLRALTGSKSRTYVAALSALGLLRYRGTRGGSRACRRRSRASVYKHDPDLNVGRLCQRSPCRSECRTTTDVNRSNLVRVPVRRYVNATSCQLVFGSLNIRSLSPLKLDNLLIESRERSIDVLALCETRHDSDSVAIRRLRADGFPVVIERTRPRRVGDTFGTNKGGVAVVATPGLHLSSVDVNRPR